MLDIGFTELLLIAVVALVVLGPEKLPMAVRTLGLWVGKAKRTISGIQSEISEELRLDELKRTASVAKEQLDSELDEMKKPFMDDLKEASPAPSVQAKEVDPETSDPLTTDLSKNPPQ
ncbi:MAG: twin-arginine translocase subunit TatB [Oceanospirillaceae bacterium]|nr:twin-arginine translocase subunit TatB [Oceanospirillaceae bacterium]